MSGLTMLGTGKAQHCVAWQGLKLCMNSEAQL